MIASKDLDYVLYHCKADTFFFSYLQDDSSTARLCWRKIEKGCSFFLSCDKPSPSSVGLARSELRYFLLKMVDLAETDVIRRYIISGARRFSNYWWGTIILLGGVGFLLAGISSYLGKDLFPPIQSKSILFFPQGLVMCFYGILGVLFSLYVWFTLLWSIGSGFNEFNREAGLVRIFRWGFPGKNRRIDICYPITDIEGIKVEWKEGLSPRRTIYMRLKGNREIPLSRVGEPTTLDQIERQAAELAKFLQVSLEMPS